MAAESFFEKVQRRLLNDSIRRVLNLDLRDLGRQVQRNMPEESSQRPVLFFDASTRLSGISLNAAFAALTAWSLELKGVPVVHFVCTGGLRPCVLGTNRKDPNASPPCSACQKQSRELFSHSEISTFHILPNENLAKLLRNLNLGQLMEFEFQGMPLGRLVLPSIRWILRRHTLREDVETLTLYRNYIQSAWSLALQFELLILENQPQQVVVFNGMQYPEATARWVARKHGLRVISHEVGMLPLTAYFTEGDATAYDLVLPKSFKLSKEQNEKLDAYLTARFKGDFHMAGVQFWPEMSQLSHEFLEKASQFKQMVPVFTNVIFDTSQPHANVIFEDMFVWLDELLRVASENLDTFFVIRAHPDEARVGKASEESVEQWAQSRNVEALPNVRFIPPQDFVNSYDLIRMAKFVMIYNSTIGLEAAILGATVLSAGKARYSASDVVFFPRNKGDYFDKLNEFLSAESLTAPAKHKTNARRFLYWQLYGSSLSFAEFIEPDGVWQGYVKLKEFDWQALLPENSLTMKTIHEGILNEGDFILREQV